ncbi:MAG: hypothetical protein GWP62_12755 [Gammaproteobacteria bacterium]|jgi:hypothetical protein|nr:hypothetical protein [Gammaproteobacteria bacterium]
MITYHRLLAVLTLTIACSGASYAETPAAADEWQFQLTPYIWLAGITGDMASDGVDLPPINPGYSFFSLDNLDGVAFLSFAATKGQWSIQSDLVFVSFADTIPIGAVDAAWDLDGGILELSAGYRPASWQHTKLIFGVRGVDLSVDAVLTPGPAGSSDVSFVDPIIGVSHQQVFDNKWGVYARGDIGSGGSDVMVNAELAGTYQFTDTFTLMFGYRYLGIEFEDSETLLDLAVYGYTIGFQFAW